jgi:hypothetical protein
MLGNALPHKRQQNTARRQTINLFCSKALLDLGDGVCGSFCFII